MPNTTPSIDLLIVGGGIAGCWTLARAINAGLNCLLLEKEALGAGQTIASQGIIHGGLKYALNAVLSRATQSIKDMPERWQQSLSGNACPNLSKTHCLSDAHYFIPTGSIDSRLISFFGSKMASSYSEKVDIAGLPDDYRQVTQSKHLYRLNEFVLDTQSLLKDFLHQYSNHMAKHAFEFKHLTPTDTGFHYQQGDLSINTRYVLSCMGNSTEEQRFNPVKLQQRPLQMVMVKGKLPTIFGHFISHGSKPLMTITSYTHNNDTLWYIGGELAESGASRTKEAQIEHCKSLIQQLVPTLNIDSMVFDTLIINRAEAKQAKLLRPDDAFVSLKNNVFIGFPTKLAFAPRFADQVISKITTEQGSTRIPVSFTHLQPPEVADFPWAHL